MKVMLHAPMRLIRLVLPHMRRRHGGTIVQIGSMGGLPAFPGNRLHVLIVEPGAFRTQLTGPKRGPQSVH